uniref:BAHD acyltransferase n=1 Tax=Kalanchoe fedtschenkoi TaxID=63787 RepID=A0A7N0TAN0_KALFE
MGIKVEISSRQKVKPSSPTPDHLRNFRISLLDQIAPAVYTPACILYRATEEARYDPVKASEKSSMLRKSLAVTLSRFYPLAGRFKDESTIECNDEGAEFLEAQVNCELSEVYGDGGQLKMELLSKFVPAEIESEEAFTGCLFLAQLSFFECGGVALGMSISHKIADGASLGALVTSWVVETVGMDVPPVFPQFDVAEVFPSVDFSVTLPLVKMPESKCTTRRFVFGNSKIYELRNKASCEAVPRPSRVEALTAFLWKCCMKTSRINSNGSIKPSVMGQTVDLRNRIAPLGDLSFGNLVIPFTAYTGESDLELDELVANIRARMNNFLKHSVEKLRHRGGAAEICETYQMGMDMVFSDEIDFYCFSSAVRFLPWYLADFGWGAPAWAGLTMTPIRNVIILTSTRDDDGVEAYVTLKERDMEVFEVDEELLSYATPQAAC